MTAPPSPVRRGLAALAGVVWLAPLACSPPAAATHAVELRGYRPATAAALRAAGWRTDLERGVVALDRIQVGDIARETFRPIASPRFARADRCELAPAEPVLVYRGQAEVRAWPLAALLRRELALDHIDGIPVAVTLCSLCASARVWSLQRSQEVLELAVSGLVLDGNGLLYDARTESLWRQLDGLAVIGSLAGQRLTEVPAFTVSFGSLRSAHPEALVMLAPAPGADPPLTRISAEDVLRGTPPAWLKTGCPRPLELVLSLDAEADGAVLLTDAATACAHRRADGEPGPALGSSAAFASQIDGRSLTFDPLPSGAVDRETGSRWNALGEAVEGPLRGSRLPVLPQVRGFRFAFTAASSPAQREPAAD